MLTKILGGAAGVLLIAVVVIGNMLLTAKEANGALRQGIEEARSVNERQALAVAELENENRRLLVAMENERRKAREATARRLAAEDELKTETAAFDDRLAAAVAGMTSEELECSNERVPDGLIDSLWVAADGTDGP